MDDERTPQAVIHRIAQVASAVAFQAGVGGMEIAGMIVSVLAEHPDMIDGFLEGGVGFMIDSNRFGAEHGCLDFHNMKGGISTPQDARLGRVARKLLRDAGATPTSSTGEKNDG